MADQTESPVAATSTAPLVGRGKELAKLHDCFAEAVRGRTTVVALAGEPGIGKSRLLLALAHRAADAGARALRGSAVDAEGMPPYLPFIEALGRHIRVTPPDRLRDQIGSAGEILAALWPTLPARLGDLSPGYVLPPEQARLRLYDAIADFLAAIADEQPLALLLDDLHWADSASLDLLRHIVRVEPERRLLIALAYRPGDAADNAILGRTLADLTRLRALTSLTLDRLDPDETAALARAWLVGAIAPNVAELLHARSDGNPFFAEELLRAWVEQGVIGQVRGRWQVARAPGAGPPATIQETVRQRLAHLPVTTVDYLRTAAVIGRQFDTDLLALASGHAPEETEEALLPAVRAQILHADDAGGYCFSHDQLRECLYAEITPLRRRRLHGFIGSALEARASDDSARGVADLAFHFARSGDRARGARYSRLAAERSLALYATAAAIQHLRMAIDLLAPDNPDRGALLLQLGSAALLENAEEEAEQAFRDARDWFLNAGDRRAAARASHGLGQIRWRQERLPEALAAFEDARDLLADAELPETVHVLTDLGVLLAVSLGRLEQGLVVSRRGLAIAQNLDDPRLQAAAGRAVGNLLIRTNDVAAGLPVLERSLALAEDIDDPGEAAECCGCLAVAYDWIGDVQRSIAVTLRRREFAERSRDRFQLRHVDTWLAAMYSYRCDWAEAERLIAQSRDFVERLGSPEPLASWHILSAMPAWMRGDYAAAEGPIDTGIALLREIGPAAAIWYLGNQAIAKLGVGKRAEALALVDELDGLVAKEPAESMASGEALTYLASLAVSMGDGARADGYAARLAPFRGQHHGYLVDRVLGECAILRGDWPAAEAFLAVAENQSRQFDNQQELAHLLRSRARLALARGGAKSATTARAHLAAALARYQQLGMSGWERQVRSQLRALPSQPLPRPATRLPAGLSERETTILRLVAVGMSNREIADRLALSEKTVANHLTAIFNKLGVDNRAGAAAFATRHGLA